MSGLRAGLLAAAVMVALVRPAATQDLQAELGNWQIQGNAHVFDPQGNTKVMRMSESGMKRFMPHAKPVPRGTAFFMNNGQLYSIRGHGMYDKQGKWMGM
jgi:hypothetical protein